MAFLDRLPVRIMASSDRSPQPSEHTPTSITSARSIKQMTLFLAGSTFFAFSALITRRAVARRYLETVPRFYAPSNCHPSENINGRLEAWKALSLATMNLASFMAMMTGGTLWAFDISSMDDLRRKVPKRPVVKSTEADERNAEQEWEAFVAGSTATNQEKEERNRENEKVERSRGKGKPR